MEAGTDEPADPQEIVVLNKCGPPVIACCVRLALFALHLLHQQRVPLLLLHHCLVVASPPCLARLASSQRSVICGSQRLSKLRYEDRCRSGRSAKHLRLNHPSARRGSPALEPSLTPPPLCQRPSNVFRAPRPPTVCSVTSHQHETRPSPDLHHALPPSGWHGGTVCLN
jgi:hypothetical protein